MKHILLCLEMDPVGENQELRREIPAPLPPHRCTLLQCHGLKKDWLVTKIEQLKIYKAWMIFRLLVLYALKSKRMHWIIPAATLKDAIHFRRASSSSVWLSALSIFIKLLNSNSQVLHHIQSLKASAISSRLQEQLQASHNRCVVIVVIREGERHMQIG